MTKLEAIKGYVGLATKARQAVYGLDNLNKQKCKFYLLFRSNDSGRNLIKQTNLYVERTKCEMIEIEDYEMIAITNMPNCKVFGIKDKKMAEVIKNTWGEHDTKSN
ncbi:MAG: hypothetical protein RR140_00660 [Clostridia bacterium]